MGDIGESTLKSRLRRRVRRAFWATIVLGAALVGAWYCQTDYRRGYIAAEVHHYIFQFDELKTYGLMPRSFSEDRQRVWDRYGIWLGVGAGCVVSDAELEYIRGYNAATEERLKARFGKDWRELFAESRHDPADVD